MFTRLLRDVADNPALIPSATYWRDGDYLEVVLLPESSFTQALNRHFDVLLTRTELRCVVGANFNGVGEFLRRRLRAGDSYRLLEVLEALRTYPPAFDLGQANEQRCQANFALVLALANRQEIWCDLAELWRNP